MARLPGRFEEVLAEAFTGAWACRGVIRLPVSWKTGCTIPWGAGLHVLSYIRYGTVFAKVLDLETGPNDSTLAFLKTGRKR